MTAGGVLAPAAGALTNELFPTSVRASATGWTIAAGVIGAVAGLVVFGAVADVGGVSNHTAFAAAVVFLPMVLFSALLHPAARDDGTRARGALGPGVGEAHRAKKCQPAQAQATTATTLAARWPAR